MKFVLILGQGRSGSTLVMRLLNLCSGVLISGENERAFDHLIAFVQTMKECNQHRNSPFHKIAWAAPCNDVQIKDALQGVVCKLYYGKEIAGFKEIRYGCSSYDLLEKDLDNLAYLMPGLKIILNLRDTKSCMNSGWWAKN